MYCQNCGKEVTGNFCSNCGAEIKAIPQVTNNEAADLNAVKKTDKRSKIIHIASLVLSAFIFILSVFSLFLNAISSDSSDLAEMVLLIAFGNAPFSLALFLASAFRGKSKTASSILYVISIVSSLFLCCLNLSCTDNFLLLPLLNILLVITAWIFGNRCAVRKIEKAQIIVYVCFVVIITCSLLFLFRGHIAYNRSADKFAEGFSRAMDENQF